MLARNLVGLKNPEDHLHDIMWGIGQVVVFWAIAEQALDFLVLFIYRDRNGNSIESEIPQARWRKTDFVRKCFRKLPTLALFKDDVIALMKRFDDIAEERNDLIHAAAESANPIKGQFSFLKIDYEKYGHQYRHITPDSASFARLVRESSALCNDTAALLHRIRASGA